jgi:hypothetical protein
MPASGSPRELGGQVGGFFPAPSPAFGCHQPGPSRTSPGARFRVASHPSSALRTVPETAGGPKPIRTPTKLPHTAGSLAARVRSRSSESDQDPSSLGVRDLAAPPPTHPTRVHSQPIRVAPGLPSGRRHHPSSSRSVLVVSHHLDGFLRAKDRGLVASHCRSWGSPRFSKPAPSALAGRLRDSSGRPGGRPLGPG